ncbi:MAG TPA: MaoC family dehydratase, partial [Roseiflexaceae bacterium]|nr:MaoC family dehydratase [Roseiflexaceae bacterium]
NMTHTLPPANERFFEDYIVGATYEFGSIAVDEDEVIAFAQRYDPQPLHIDPEAARRSPFGGLIASGWHSASLMMRLFVDHYLSPVSSVVSPGIDELRWLKPVRPGDTLAVRVTIVDSNRSRSRPDRGIVRSEIEVLNQHGEAVMSLKAANLILCREAQ